MDSLKMLFPESYKRVVKWNEIARNTPPSQEDQETLVLEEMKELSEAVEEGDIVGAVDGVCDIFVTGAYLEEIAPDSDVAKKALATVLAGINVLGHIFVADALLEVLDSNDSKFVDISARIYEDSAKVENLISSEIDRLSLGTGLDIRAEVKHDKVVFLDQNNKIRKPFCYRKPHLEGIVDKYLSNKAKEEIIRGE